MLPFQSMHELFLPVVLPTAVLSSVFTCLFLYIAYRRKIKPYLRGELARQVGHEVEEGVSRAIEKHLPEFQDRVKHGLIEGITDMPNHAPRMTSEMIRGSMKNLDIFRWVNPQGPDQK